jgi:hypothetical protein
LEEENFMLKKRECERKKEGDLKGYRPKGAIDDGA